jgi:uncharacterized protein (DUF2147 family)
MSTWIKRRYGVAIMIASAALLTGGARADTAPERQILGTWLTQDKQGLVQIYLAASGKYEGRIVFGSGEPDELDSKNPDPALRTRSLNGAVILQGFRYAGDGKWTEGTIYDPDNGKTYKCTMELKSADTLSIRGYIGVPLLGRSVLWTRKRE